MVRNPGPHAAAALMAYSVDYRKICMDPRPLLRKPGKAAVVSLSTLKSQKIVPALR